MRKLRFSALCGVAALVAVAFSGLAPAPALAAPQTASCDYADPAGGGKFPSSICWFDFTGYDPVLGAAPGGQQFEMSLGAYEVSYSVLQRSIPGRTSRSVVASAATTPPFLIGGAGYYQGIAGLPFLYSTSGALFGAVQISIENFEVTLNGTPVDGYELVTAAPETPDAPVGQFGEYINWASDQPLTLIDSRSTSTTGGGCSVPFAGDGTTNVWCNPALPGTQSVYGAILSAPSATQISGSLYMSSRGEREALGFGIRTARVSVEKQVSGRVDPADSFDIDIVAPQGPLAATATTGSADSASTGLITVIPDSPITLSDNMSAGSLSPLSYYTPSWSCTNATVGSSTTLPSGAAPTQSLDLAAGDAVSCVVTNTPKRVELTLVKSTNVDHAAVGDTVDYSFLVTNTGELPVDGLTIDEGAFSGTGTLTGLSCPVSTLAMGESTTCHATYFVTQDDVDAMSVTNEASASAEITGTTASVDSPLSNATFTTGGNAIMAVSKSANVSATHVGDTITYTLTAMNTGALTLHDVTLHDTEFSGSAPLGPLDCDTAAPVTLSPGAVLTCTVTYLVRTTDIGTLSNTVTGTAIDPQGGSLVGTDSVDVLVTAVAPPAHGGSASLAVTGGTASFAIVAAAAGSALALVGAVYLIASRRRRAS